MEESRYNFWSTTPDGAHLLFNGRTGALIEFEAHELEMVTDALAGAPGPWTDVMASSGFVVDDAGVEQESLVERLLQGSGPSPILELTIAPTYGCNFRCDYCYVHFEDRRMDRDAAERILKYVDEHLPQHAQANITWFGGEPLLQWRLVAEMAAQLTQIGAKHRRPLLQFLTTNGYLLTSKVTQSLVDAGIIYFHITIDGADAGQNQRRVLRDGRPTYQRVLENLTVLLEQHPEARVTLRMNLEPDSVALARPLLQAISPSLRNRIQVHATPVIRAGVVRDPQLHREIADVISTALELGYVYYDNAIPVGRASHCTAESSTTFQVGPGGELHKCSPSGKPEVTVGSLNQAGLPVLRAEATEVWEGVGLPQECSDCQYLCFRGGGCRLTRLREESSPSCADPYVAMESLVRNLWMARTRAMAHFAS